MRNSTILLITAIFLPILSYVVIYFIAKSQQCDANCDGKPCGYRDECGNLCKKCPSGTTCDGTSCQSVSSEKFRVRKKDKSIRGICYFDIDNTLTSAQGNPDEIIQECLDNNFAVGIITASGRTIDDICSGDKAGGYQNANWMSDKLCKQFRENDGKMFNSLRIVAGKTVFPKDYPSDKTFGYIKGFDMDYGKTLSYPSVPDKCVVLFDDNPDVLRGVKKYNPSLETQCSHPTCGGQLLTKEIVREKIQSMIANGCH
jgi:hypothetical protein